MIASLCNRCGSDLIAISNGKGRMRMYCRRCHALDMRTKYKASRNRAAQKHRRTPKYSLSRAEAARKECGVRSSTSKLSKRSERFADQARKPWGLVEDDILMNSGLTEGQLVKRLGRSIRAIQRRKWT